jgi:TetR/AcrR family transcriptional repressor of bet genes
MSVEHNLTEGQKPAARARTARRAQARRRQIVEAAVATVARFGLSRTTIEQVARAAKVSPGTVMGYFPTKDDLLIAVLRDLAEEFDGARRAALAAGGDDPAAALLALIETNFDPKLIDPRKVAVWYAFWGEAKARRTYMTICGRLDESHLSDQRRLCAKLVAAGGYAHLDPEAVALGLNGVMEGLWQSVLVEGRRFDRNRARRLCRAFLAGLFPHEFGPQPSGPQRTTH